MITYILIGIIVLFGIGFLIKSSNKKEIAETSKSVEKKSEENPYLDMRKMAFSATADQLGIENIENDKVYGLITEIGMNPGSATVISFITGDASLYLSSGGGFIGAGQHEDVRKLVTEKVNGFQKYLSYATKVEKFELPKNGTVDFNFLTKNGIYKKTENMTDLESGKSELSELFVRVNEIISEIRLKSEK